MSIFNKRLSFYFLLGIVLLGLGLRITFQLVGIEEFYHSHQYYYFNGDSGSYMLAFENLWNSGSYTFDFFEPDASFGRLPGYPFFYGIHYILFGAVYGPVATAWTQLFLDTATIIVVFKIIRHVNAIRPASAFIGAFLYATYPFVIVWGPVIGSEALSTDLTLFWFYIMLVWRPTPLYAMGVGALIAVSLFMREYMGVLLPITIIWVLLQHNFSNAESAIRLSTLVVVGFGLLYLSWPVRNYILTHRIILLKPTAAGYSNQTADVNEFFKWVHCWTADENPWLDSLLISKEPIHFPRTAFSHPTDEARSKKLVVLARNCGSGFYVIREGISSWGHAQDTAMMRTNTTYWRLRSTNCNLIVSSGFQKLRQDFIAKYPLRYWLDVPTQNLYKAFFKRSLSPIQAIVSKTTLSSTSVVQWFLPLLFAYRSLLLILGWTGILIGLRQNKALYLITSYCVFQYFYICFIYRGLEMRYLLQADVLLLIPAAIVLERLINWFRLVPMTQLSPKRHICE